MRVLSLGNGLNKTQYKDIFKELQKFNDLEFKAATNNNKQSEILIPLNIKKSIFSNFSKDSNIYFEKNQLRKLLYEFTPDIIEIHAEPHHRLCDVILDCCMDIELSPAFILYPKRSFKDLIFPPYKNIRRKTLNRVSFIVIRNDSLKEELRDSPFRNSYRKIAFPAYKIEKRTDKDIFNILIHSKDELSEKNRERLCSISDYSERIRFNIIGNVRTFKLLKNEGFKAIYIDNLSREEMIVHLSGIDLVISDTDSGPALCTIIPFAFYNKIPYISLKKEKNMLNLEEINEYQLKKIILKENESIKTILEDCRSIALKEYSAGRCAFDTYELYKFLFKTNRF